MKLSIDEVNNMTSQQATEKLNEINELFASSEVSVKDYRSLTILLTNRIIHDMKSQVKRLGGIYNE